MHGENLEIESCFVGAAVLTGAKVVKGISKVKKDFDFKAAGNTPPLNLEKKTTGEIKTTADLGKKQFDETVIIIFIGLLILGAFYLGRKVK
jgi:hypothetical protein